MLGHRAEALNQLAFNLQMQFSPKDEWGLLNFMSDFKLFRRGFGKRISNILQQQDPLLETDLHIFDYRYTISSGNSSRRIQQTVFFMQSRRLGLPEFFMQPENFLHRIGEFLGIDDIDFEEAPSFSKQYFLRGRDEDFIRASLPEPFLHFFTVEKNWHLEGMNYFLLFYRKNHLMPPEGIKDFYQKGMKICEMLAAG